MTGARTKRTASHDREPAPARASTVLVGLSTERIGLSTVLVGLSAERIGLSAVLVGLSAERVGLSTVLVGLSTERVEPSTKLVDGLSLPEPGETIIARSAAPPSSRCFYRGPRKEAVLIGQWRRFSTGAVREARFPFVFFVQDIKPLPGPLRPDGVPGCSHGSSEAVPSRGQPVGKSTPVLPSAWRDDGGGRQAGRRLKRGLRSLRQPGSARQAIPVPCRGMVFVCRFFPRVALRLAALRLRSTRGYILLPRWGKGGWKQPPLGIRSKPGRWKPPPLRIESGSGKWIPPPLGFNSGWLKTTQPPMRTLAAASASSHSGVG